MCTSWPFLLARYNPLLDSKGRWRLPMPLLLSSRAARAGVVSATPACVNSRVAPLRSLVVAGALAVAADFAERVVVVDLPFALPVCRLRHVRHDETADLCAQRAAVAAGRAEVNPAVDARVERLVRCLREAHVGAHDVGNGLGSEGELGVVAEVRAQHH